MVGFPSQIKLLNTAKVCPLLDPYEATLQEEATSCRALLFLRLIAPDYH